MYGHLVEVTVTSSPSRPQTATSTTGRSTGHRAVDVRPRIVPGLSGVYFVVR